MTEEEIKQYIANLERSGGTEIKPGPGAASVEQQRQQTLRRAEMGLLTGGTDETALPAIGGFAGGILPFVAPQARVLAPLRALTAASPAAVRTLVPSLAGSTAGTLLGTAGEYGLSPTKEIMSKQFAKAALSNVVENAFWDIGGNLVMSVAGKTYKVAKNLIGEKTILDDARTAAQDWLSQRGATLTKAQLTNDPVSKMTETVLKGSPGVTLFEKQQAGVKTAINKGIADLKEGLQTSEAFKAALSTDEPLTRAAGENFQNLITTARQEFSAVHRPFYDSLAKDYNVMVDMRGIKAKAQAEMERLGRIKEVGAAADRKTVLQQILAQDDMIELGAAHDLRSAFYGAGQDLKLPSGASSSKGQAFDSYAKEIEQSMDNVIDLSKGKIGKDLLAKYKQTQAAYRAGKEGLFNTTIEEAMALSPSKVGKYLADLSESEKFTDLFKAVSVIDDVSKGAKDTAGILGDVKYNFIEANLNSAEKSAKFAKKLNDNADMNRAFFKMFRNEAPELKSILNAADFGLEKGGAASTVLRNRLTSLAASGTSAVGLTSVGYLALPEEVQDRLSTNLPSTLLAAGSLIITPRMMARAATNKDAMDALAGLAAASSQPKFGGAAAAKLVDQLNKSGIIDSEYISTVDNFFNAPEQPKQPEGPTDPEEYLKRFGTNQGAVQ